MSRYSAFSNLHPDNYQRSPLHAENRIWIEKNCYIDIWIELLHSQGLDPRAIMPFTIAIDFEGDQCTFFKPSHDDIREAYGIDIQELTVWRTLLEHSIEHLSAGKLISTEADAFWLPDTAGTDYRTQHTKSTIVINDLDLDQQRLGYFHNASYYFLEGEDFIKTFRLDASHDPTFMPLFAELVRVDRVQHRTPQELARFCWSLLQKYIARLPTSNPVERFRARVAQDLTSMQDRGLQHYHSWAFASTRQLGAAFELAAETLRWLATHGYEELEPAIVAFDNISTANKTFILKGARAINSRKPLDLAIIFDGMSASWEQGMQALIRAA